jgi:hypothetical protein
LNCKSAKTKKDKKKEERKGKRFLYKREYAAKKLVHTALKVAYATIITIIQTKKKKKPSLHMPAMKRRTLPKVGVHGFREEHPKEDKLK